MTEDHNPSENHDKTTNRKVIQTESDPNDEIKSISPIDEAKPSRLRTEPYIGPGPFDWKDKDYFFGRKREARKIISLLHVNSIVVVYAESGAGKTSLFRAKVIPDMREEFNVVGITRVQGRVVDNTPKGEFFQRNALNNLITYADLMEPDPDNPQKNNIEATSLKELIAKHPRKELEGFSNRKNPNYQPKIAPYVIIFDQLEEIFNLFPRDAFEERRAFFEQINDLLLNTKVRIVFVLREEYLPKLDTYKNIFQDRLDIRFHLRLLEPNAALVALKEPLNIEPFSAYSFDSGVAEQLVSDLQKIRVKGENDQLMEINADLIEPVQLQVVAFNFWKKASSETKLFEVAHLEEHGDIENALSGFYESIINEVCEKFEDLSEYYIRTWFERKLITPIATRDNVYEVDDQVAGLPIEAVRFLEDRHLIRSYFHSRNLRYELIHDRFVEPILNSNKNWNVDNLWIAAAARWNSEIEQGRDGREYLLNGVQLQEVKKFLELNRELVSDTESRFIEESDKVFQKEFESARTRVRITNILAMAIALLGFFGAIFVFVLNNKNQALRERETELENKVQELENAKTEADDQRRLAEINEEKAKENQRIAEASSEENKELAGDLKILVGKEESARRKAESLRELSDSLSLDFQYKTFQSNARTYENSNRSNNLAEKVTWANAAIALGMENQDDEYALRFDLRGLNQFRWESQFGTDQFIKFIQPDAETVMALTQNGTIYRGNLGKSEWQFRSIADLTVKCEALVYANATGEFFYLREDGIFKYDVNGNIEPITYGMKEQVILKPALFLTSRNQLYFVSGNSLMVYDVIENTRRKLFELPIDVISEISHLVVDENLQKIAIVHDNGSNNSLSIIELSNGKELFKENCRRSTNRGLLRQFGNKLVYIHGESSNVTKEFDFSASRLLKSRDGFWRGVGFLDGNDQNYRVIYSNGQVLTWAYGEDSPENREDLGLRNDTFKYIERSSFGTWAEGKESLTYTTFDSNKQWIRKRNQAASKLAKIDLETFSVITIDGVVEKRSLKDNTLLDSETLIEAEEIHWVDGGAYFRQRSSLKFYDLTTHTVLSSARLSINENSISDLTGDQGDIDLEQIDFYHVMEGRRGVIAIQGGNLYRFEDRTLNVREKLFEGIPRQLISSGDSLFILYTLPYKLVVDVFKYTRKKQDTTLKNTGTNLITVDLRKDQLVAIDYNHQHEVLSWATSDGALRTAISGQLSQFLIRPSENQGQSEIVSVGFAGKQLYLASRDNGELEIFFFNNEFYHRGTATPFVGSYVKDFVPIDDSSVLLLADNGNYCLYDLSEKNFESINKLPYKIKNTGHNIIWGGSPNIFISQDKIIVDGIDTLANNSKIGDGNFIYVETNESRDKIAAFEKDGNHLSRWDRTSDSTYQLTQKVNMIGFKNMYYKGDTLFALRNNRILQIIDTLTYEINLTNTGLELLNSEPSLFLKEGNKVYLTYGELHKIAVLDIRTGKFHVLATIEDEPKSICLGGKENEYLIVGGVERLFVLDLNKSRDEVESKRVINLGGNSFYLINNVFAIPDTDIVVAGSKQQIYFVNVEGSGRPFRIEKVPEYVYQMKLKDRTISWTGQTTYGTILLPDFNGILPGKEELEKVTKKTVRKDSRNNSVMESIIQFTLSTDENTQ